jgi:hypothetical protein
VNVYRREVCFVGLWELKNQTEKLKLIMALFFIREGKRCAGKEAGNSAVK